MMSGLYARQLCFATVFVALCACSGGGGASRSSIVPIATPVRAMPVVAATATPSAPQQQSVRLFIPAKAPAISTSRARKPNYVSYNTLGVEITTSQTATATNGSTTSTTLQQLYFSTVPAHNPNCSSVSGGFSCTFSITAAAPSTNFAISTFDAEPTTSGSTTTDTGHILSSGSSANVTIVPDQANTVPLTLGGIVDHFTISIFANGNTTALANNAVFSLVGGVPTSGRLSYAAYDASNEQILAANSNGSGSLSNGVTIAVSEPGSPNNGHVTVTLNNSGTPGTTATSNNTADTFQIAYDGLGTATTDANAYDAVVTASAPALTDANGNTASAPASIAFTIAPLFLEAFVPPANANDKFTAASAGSSPTPASFAYGYQGSNGGVGPTYSRISIVQFALPTGSNGYTAATTASGCTDFSFPVASPGPAAGDADYGSAANFDAEYSTMPSSGATCAVALSDGVSTATLNASYVATSANGTITSSSNVNWVTAVGRPMQYNRAANNQTFRVLMTPTVGSRGTARIHLSNFLGTNAVTVGNVHAGVLSGSTGTKVVASTDVPITFNGSSATTLAAGAAEYSDPFPLATTFGQTIALTMFLPGSQSLIPVHNNVVFSSYMSAANSGDETADQSGSSFTATQSYDYLVDHLDLLGNYTGTIALGGSSTTVGVGAATDSLQDLGSALATDLHNAGHDDLAVANMASAPNPLQSKFDANAEQTRYSRDFLSLPTLFAIVQNGGDLDLKQSCDTATDLISTEQSLTAMTQQANAKMVLAVIAPATYCPKNNPSGYGSRYAQGSGEDAEREALNAWIESTSPSVVEGVNEQPPLADAFSDISTPVTDPSNTGYPLPQYDVGDDGHVNAAGQALQAQALANTLLSLNGI